jgi:alkylated DNA repair dioxygenase AlkB
MAFVTPVIKQLFFSFDDDLVNIPKKYDSIKNEYDRLHMKIASLFKVTKTYANPGINYIYITHPTKLCNDCVVPKGLCVIKSIITKFKLNKMYKLLDLYTKEAIRRNDVTSEITKNKNRIFFWESSINDTLSKLEQYPILQKEIFIFVDKLSNVLKIKFNNKEDYMNKVKLTLIRYKSNVGLYTHVDNIRRAGQGPIITLSIGPDKTIYDIIPLKKKYGKSIRIYINNGDLLSISDDARFHWVHSLPYGYKYKQNNNVLKYRFALLVRLPSTKSKKYFSFWNETIRSYDLCEQLRK